MNVAVCIASGDLIHADTAMSLAQLTAYSVRCGIGVALVNTKSSLVQRGRRLAVEHALEIGADYLFFMDSDMVVPPDTVRRLLAHRKPICGAIYPRRNPPYGMTGQGGSVEQGRRGMGKMDRMPTGCLLIDMKVFRTLPRPWFSVEWDEDLQDEVGEDYTFCDQARVAGFQPWVDYDLSREVRHIGAVQVDWSMCK